MSMTVPTAVSTSGLRRVTVVSPRARMDVALPVQCTLAELVPQLVRLAGMRADGTGWALSRIGGPALPPGLTVAAAALADGEVLHLTAQVGAATPLLFDDVVDAIASAARTRRGAWRPTVGRRVGLASAALLFTGMTALALTAWSGSVRAPVAAGVLAVALLLAGAALARAYRDVLAGCACAGAGTVAALAAGLTALPPHTVWPGAEPLAAPGSPGAPISPGTPGSLAEPGSLAVPESLAVGLAAVALHAVLAAVVVARHVWFVGVAAAAGAGALVTACVLLFDATPANVAAIAVTLLTALAAFAPMVSLKMAGLPLPNVPEDMDAFRADERPALGSEVLEVTSAAARLLAGVVTALGVAAAGCAGVLLFDGRAPWPSVLVGLVGVAWLLRSRSYAAAATRVSLIGVGLVVLAGLGVRTASEMGTDWLVTSAVGLAIAGALCVVYAGRVVRGAHSPFRARWLDILEYLVLISLLPVAGAVLDLYNAVRDLVS